MKIVDNAIFIPHIGVMNVIGDLLRVIDAFAVARRVSDARASTLIFGDGTRVKHLRAGGDMGALRIERALLWLSENWPDGGVWPPDVGLPCSHSSSRGVTAAGDDAHLGEALAHQEPSASPLSSDSLDLEAA